MDILIIISYIVLILVMPVLMYLEHEITCRRLEHSIFWNQYFEILHTPDDNIADVKMDIYKKCYEEVWDEKKKLYSMSFKVLAADYKMLLYFFLLILKKERTRFFCSSSLFSS